MAATLSLVGGRGQFTWTISGLNNWFANNQYYQAGVATKAVVGGSTSLPSDTQIVSSVFAEEYPPEDDNYGVSETVTYSSGTYTFYGFVQTVDGNGNPNEYYPVGSGEVTISDSGSGIALFDWFGDADHYAAYRFLTRASPASFEFKASVWNDIVKKVSEAYRVWWEGPTWDEGWNRDQYGEYKSRAQCMMSPGDFLRSDVYNSVFWNVTCLPDPPDCTINMVSPGDEITASHILELVEMINTSIPNIW